MVKAREWPRLGPLGPFAARPAECGLSVDHALGPKTLPFDRVRENGSTTTALLLRHAGKTPTDPGDELPAQGTQLLRPTACPIPRAKRRGSTSRTRRHAVTEGDSPTTSRCPSDLRSPQPGKVRWSTSRTGSAIMTRREATRTARTSGITTGLWRPNSTARRDEEYHLNRQTADASHGQPPVERTRQVDDDKRY